MAHEQRRLATILFADAVGSSRLMGRDESGTVARLLEHLNLRLAPAVARRGGRVIRLKGDGGLIEFASAVDALAAAIEFQQVMVEANRGQPDDKAIVFRIGLHLGDVIVDGDDIYGDDVNVAARLETEAPPGGIVISRAVREAVHGRLKANLHAMGELALKNIDRPIRAFRVEWTADDWPTSGSPASPMELAPALTLPDKPSIAVLPFQNMSDDPEQEYFIDGLVDEIITALSRFRSLFVIARNSSFAYKGKSPDLRQVGRDLGVRYVLEGSVRKASGRLRITAQLIDATSGAHAWADRFEGALKDVFELQDDVTEKVVTAIAPRVEQAEVARARRRPSGNTDAYDCYLRGLACLSVLTAENLERALHLFTQATDLDPDFAPAYGMAMWCYVNRIGLGVLADSAHGKSEVMRLRGLVELVGQEDDVALGQAAWAVAHVLRDLPSAKDLVERALALNPNLASAWVASGWINMWMGHPDTAMEHLQRSQRLDPGASSAVGPRWFRWSGLAHAHFFLGQHEEGLATAEQLLHYSPDNHTGLRIGAASAAFAGRADTAHRLAARLKVIDPAFSVSRLSDYLGPYQKTVLLEKYAEGLRLAGLPE